jgi:hypothetical protein
LLNNPRSADTLDACTATNIQQLRQVNACYIGQYSRALPHDFTASELWIDIDLSPLPAGRHAEASLKGFVSGKKTPTVANWCGSVRRSINGGFGTDANINWQLWRGYQILTKGFSGNRAKAQARQITEWEAVRSSLWVAPVVEPIRYGRHTQSLVRRWLDEQKRFKYATLITSLCALTASEVVRRYDGRGAIESEDGRLSQHPGAAFGDPGLSFRLRSSDTGAPVQERQRDRADGEY